jgi:MYXO-CTERM domain-containing protein
VSGFWEQYRADGGIEQGGCGGGPAGALALLGVALALRRLRRRS